jgi:lysozyme
MTKPLVIDIYHGDPVYDFEKTKASGIVGVIHKATEGIGMVDHVYHTRQAWAINVELKWGAYHFLHPGNGAGQADFFLDFVKPDKDTLIALDWEMANGVIPSYGTARAFLERIAEKLGRKAKIYSGNAAKEKIQGKDAWFSAHDLWLAQYGAHWSVQESWQWPWLWQNNGDGSGPGPHIIPGIHGLCDNNTIVEPQMTVEKLMETWAL